LDPRQYDPRRIVREALVEEDTAIRESKRRERSSNESAPTSGDGGEADSSADASAAAKMREQSPIERFQAQAELRDRSTGAPFDPEATCDPAHCSKPPVACRVSPCARKGVRDSSTVRRRSRGRNTIRPAPSRSLRRAR